MKSLVILLSIFLIGCGPSVDEIDARIDRAVASAVAAIPAPTPQLIPSPLPTPTLLVFPTPLPTPTPVTFPTPLPTPTPATFPTPLPTSTPAPTSTPFVLPTPQPPGPISPPLSAPTPVPTATPTTTDFSGVYSRVWPSVFYIETPQGWGTGWLIDRDRILTTQHIVAGYSSVTVRQASLPPFTATVIAFDIERDIALLGFSSAQIPPDTVPLQLGQLTPDEIAKPLMALGYSRFEVSEPGLVGLPAANVGVFSQTIHIGAGQILNIVIDVPVDPADSGGPVFDMNGFVVGMVRLRADLGTFYALHEEEIRAALPRLRLGGSS